MNVLLLLIPISLVLLGVAVWALVWAVRDGQFDDLETPALEMLVEFVPRLGSSSEEPKAPSPLPLSGDRAQRRFLDRGGEQSR